MAPDVTPEDVLEPRPKVGTMLRRGLARRCPRCGGGNLYRGWFRMHDRCPTCGIQFEREPGFFVGAYLINFAITEGFLFVALMGYVFYAMENRGTGLTIPLLIGGIVAIVAPLLFYPYSRTIWSAIDLIMTPLELDEIASAQEWLEAGGDRDDGGEPAGGVGDWDH